MSTTLRLDTLGRPVAPATIPASFRCWRCNVAPLACGDCVGDWIDHVDMHTPRECVTMANAGRDEDCDAAVVLAEWEHRRKAELQRVRAAAVGDKRLRRRRLYESSPRRKALRNERERARRAAAKGGA